MGTEEKNILRQEARRHRAMMDLREEVPDAACALFFESLNPAPSQSAALYWPTGKEFDPFLIAQELQARGHVCALPVVEKDTLVLKFAVWKEGDPLEEGAFGIPCPVLNAETVWIEPDIVIVPLLAFDRRGYRLGQGGGYYDATLRDLRARKPIEAVGLAYARQACLFNLPVEPHDEPLDWVITPQEAHCFKRETKG
jgi:5-formyltetrahydrofolate cyclo-ligase